MLDNGLLHLRTFFKPRTLCMKRASSIIRLMCNSISQSVACAKLNRQQIEAKFGITYLQGHYLLPERMRYQSWNVSRAPYSNPEMAISATINLTVKYQRMWSEYNWLCVFAVRGIFSRIWNTQSPYPMSGLDPRTAYTQFTFSRCHRVLSVV